MNLKNIKTVFIILCITLLGSVITLQGQTPSPAGKGSWSLEKVLNTYTRRLALSAPQVVKMRTILQESYRQLQTDQATFKNNRQGLTNASMARMARTDQQVQSMLTRDQLARYLAYKQEMMEKNRKAK